MRRGRIFIYLALILIFGFAAVFILGRDLIFPPAVTPEGAEPEIPATPTPSPVTVVVVTQRVPRGEILREELLDEVPYQEDLFLPGMFTKKEDIVGKRARYDLEAYTVLTDNLVSETAVTAQGSDAALLIDPGWVAVSIPISRLSSVSFAPQRGDRVNVIVTLLFIDVDTAWQSILPNTTGNVIAPGGGGVLPGGGSITSEDIRTIIAQPFAGGSLYGRAEEDLLLEQTFYLFPSEPQRPRLVSQTLIQDVMVLQMGDFPVPEEFAGEQPLEEELAGEATPTPVPPSQQQEQVEEEQPKVPDVISLVVRPQDAVTLNYLVFSGAQLTLALRAPTDRETPPTEAVTLQFLLDTYNIPIPVKLPYGTQPRIDELVPPVLPNDIVPTPEG